MAHTPLTGIAREIAEAISAVVGKTASERCGDASVRDMALAVAVVPAIAAAPDLLEVAEAFVLLFDSAALVEDDLGDSKYADVARLAFAAIARARPTPEAFGEGVE